MNPALQAILQTIYRRPYLALIAVVGVCIAPACNLTVAEWKDAVDASAASKWEAELVIDVWFSAVTNVLISIFAYLNSPLNKTDK